MRYLIFRIKNEFFGVDVFKVVEIIRPSKFHHVYDLPEFIEGLINLRGELIPVVSMRKRFGIQEAADKTKIIIIRLDNEKIGLEVDEVLEISEIRENNIAKPSRVFKGFKAEFIEAVTELKNDRVAIILDLDKVLTTEEKIRLKNSKEQLQKESKKNG